MLKIKIEQASLEYTESITQFQVEMAAESEGTTLNKDVVHRGVTEGLKDNAKGIYIVARNNEGERCCFTHDNS